MKKEFLKKKIARIYDSVTKDYDFYMSQTNHQVAQEKILKALYNKIRGKVLDIATGTGFIAQKIKENCQDVEVVGIDMSKKMIERAKRNIKEKGLKIKFLVADAEKLNFPDQSFDVVICSLGFLWFLDKDSVFRELKRVVRKGGRIIVIEEEGKTVRSGKKDMKRFSLNLQSFFRQIEKLETPVSLSEIKEKLKSFSCQFEKEYRTAIDENHSFVGMVFRV